MQAIIREEKEEVGNVSFEKLIPTIKKLNRFEINFSKEVKTDILIMNILDFQQQN